VKRIDLEYRAFPAWTTHVHVGAGLFSRLAADLAADPPAHRYAILHDRTVGRLYGARLQRALARVGQRAERVSFPAGEAAKTRETKQRIEDRLLKLGAGRDWAILALGGGVTGDLAGFVAATWHRGVPLIQVPTTLLAMIDAAVGGKTAVNLRGGKNLVGAMHQPLAVWADVATLGTLSDRVYREGLAELVKAAVIADAGLFRWLEAHVNELRSRKRAVVIEAVTRAIRIKGRVVRQDERELGRRAILNFGHTVGHALESLSGYTLRHGSAVAIGMAVEARLAVQLGGFTGRAADRLIALLRAFDLPVELPAGSVPARIVGATRADKKSRRGRARYALPAALGRMTAGSDVTREVEDSAVLRALRRN